MTIVQVQRDPLAVSGRRRGVVPPHSEALEIGL
jgi:hypothetical protein